MPAGPIPLSTHFHGSGLSPVAELDVPMSQGTRWSLLDQRDDGDQGRDGGHQVDNRTTVAADKGRQTRRDRGTATEKRRTQMDQPTAEQALRELEPLVGEWILEARYPGEEPWPGGGTASFAWHPSGALLLQRGTMVLPEAPDSSCVIGCDAANGTYTQLYIDERGVCRIYQMSIGNGEWTLWREGEPFAQRFTASFSDDGDTITGRWEAAQDADDYAVDFELVYRRAAPTSPGEADRRPSTATPTGP